MSFTTFFKSMSKTASVALGAAAPPLPLDPCLPLRALGGRGLCAAEQRIDPDLGFERLGIAHIGREAARRDPEQGGVAD